MLLSVFPSPGAWPFLAVVSVLGLITGSFLNAVIHRLPRGISLLDPKRSFCPGCGKMIPWHENLPLASWVLLRGRCSGCAMPIALRYPLVEMMTAGFYLLAWERFSLPLAVVFWIFLSFLVAATFIDLDHLIIPDEITLGGTAAGLLCATLLPELLETSRWWQGLLCSVLGAAVGFFLLWGVVELGKKAFGRRRIRCDEPVLLELVKSGGGGESTSILKLGEEEQPFPELFYRRSDRVEAKCSWVEIAGERLGAGMLILESTRVIFGQREWPLPEIAAPAVVRAEVSELVLPREAMGFGDVKFLACIGAFLGWKGVLFSLFAGSSLGAVIGIMMLLLTRGRSGGRMPFGPYLALGAALWVFAGPELLGFYCAHLQSEAFFLLSPHPPV